MIQLLHCTIICLVLRRSATIYIYCMAGKFGDLNSMLGKVNSAYLNLAD